MRIYIIFSLYYIFIVLGLSFSYPIEAIPDETAQLLNVYAMIQNHSLHSPYESPYTIWTHLFLLPFVLIFWGFQYVYLGFPDLVYFKTYVASNYTDVLPFARAAASAFFLLSFFLLSKVIKSYFNNRVTTYLTIFLLLDLLLFINLHYSKHWTIDIGWIFISIYTYHLYLNRLNRLLIFISSATFGFAIFATPPLIASLPIYLIMMYSKGLKNTNIYDIFFAFLVVITIFLLTLWLGPGLYFGNIFYSGSSNHLDFSWELPYKLFLTLFDYNRVLFVIFVASIILSVKDKKWATLFLLSPSVLYLLIMSVFHYEPRYNLFVEINIAIFSAIVVANSFNSFYRRVSFISILIVNSMLLITWTDIITTKDTRVLAMEWIKSNATKDSFVVYNTWGFNYVPITNDSALFIQKYFPKSLSTRERIHINLGLLDGVNGSILRKINEGGYNGAEFMKRLISLGYEPILINERFGKDAHFSQPGGQTYFEILNNCKYDVVETITPFKNTPDDYERYGDILYNFTGVFSTLMVFDRPGPVVTIYKIRSKQLEGCI
jgi:hypothetical protein